jgi:hypothetical protein
VPLRQIQDDRHNIDDFVCQLAHDGNKTSDERMCS